MSEIIELNKDNIQNLKKLLFDKNKTAIIKFWAEWCGPCKKYAPIFEKYAEKTTNFIFAEVNIDEDDGTLTNMFSIKSIPTTVVVDSNMKVVNRINGAITENQLEELTK